jgi:hypothetical protein
MVYWMEREKKGFEFPLSFFEKAIDIGIGI